MRSPRVCTSIPAWPPVLDGSFALELCLPGTRTPLVATRSLIPRVCTVLPCTVLVGLYEEPDKPGNAIDFIKMTLGAPSGVDVDALKAENEQLKQKVDDLELKLKAANEKLEAGAAE